MRRANAQEKSPYRLLSRVSAVILYIVDVLDYLLKPIILIADGLNAFFHKINMIEVTKNIDNRFTPLFFFDLVAGLFLWMCTLLISCDFMLLPFDPFSHTIFVIIIAFWGFLFIRKGVKAWIYQHRLSFIAPETMTNSQLPTMAGKKTAKGYDLFMGTGFKWTAEHRQRLHTFVQQRAKSKWVKISNSPNGYEAIEFEVTAYVAKHITAKGNALHQRMRAYPNYNNTEFKSFSLCV